VAPARGGQQRLPAEGSSKDSDQVGSVAEWHWMGNAPCEWNADGECDVTERERERARERGDA